MSFTKWWPRSLHSHAAMQVSVTLLVPSLLLTKVGSIMAQQHSLRLLSIPLIAATQVSTALAPASPVSSPLIQLF